MKNIVRVFALALVATGAAASYHTSTAAAQSNTTQVSLHSATPMPSCEPGSGSCGF